MKITSGFIIFLIVVCLLIGSLVYSWWKNLPHNRVKNLEAENARLKEELREKQEEFDKQKSRLSHLLDASPYLAIDRYPEIFDPKTYEIQRRKIEELSIANQQLQDAQNELSDLRILFDEEINKTKKLRQECKRLKERNALLEPCMSNLTAFPYMAKIIADIDTREIEKLAISLDWGANVERAKKVQSIREIRSNAQSLIESYKIADYQLHYLLQLYPALQDIIESDYNDLPSVGLSEITVRDPVHDYLTKEEYHNLSSTDRNQLALNRYLSSHNKTRWQVGRDYELYIGFLYQKKGAVVDFTGSYMGLEDLGRDLIVHKPDGNLLIVQCKYWSSVKQIHEKHIMQLYGSVVTYSLQNYIKPENIKGVLVTNIVLSSVAKKVANYLGIEYRENVQVGDFPRIKCNIGHDEYGIKTKIYHLPFDQQYDSVKIDAPGEFMAMTVKEAEDAGFRRAYKWFGK